MDINNKLDKQEIYFDEVELNFILDAIKDKKQHIEDWVLDAHIKKMSLNTYNEIEIKILRSLNG